MLEGTDCDEACRGLEALQGQVIARVVHSNVQLLSHAPGTSRPRPLQVLWTFSIYLEAVAILPQLVLLQRTQNIDNLTGNYVFLLG